MDGLGVSVIFLLAGGIALAAAIAVGVLFAWEPGWKLVREKWKQYEKWADGELRSIFSTMRARDLARKQVLFAIGGLVVGTMLPWLNDQPPEPILGVILGAFAGYLPIFLLSRDKQMRRDRMEQQLDSTLQSLANTILVTQNLEDAFETIARQFDPPIAQEADVLVKQVRLGMPMDQALRDLADRVKSRNIDALVTALTIGRQTGGELPKVLENTAEVLRETMRVEGVMAAKTSEGKAQGVVMGMLPFLFGGALQIIDPEWMRPLFHDPVGYAILTAVCALEVVGVAMIRKLSQIDV